MAKALAVTQSDDVDVDRPLQDIGIDSLIAVLMRNHLANLTGLKLALSFVFSTSISEPSVSSFSPSWMMTGQLVPLAASIPPLHRPQ